MLMSQISDGHYVSYCRNDLDKQWYEYDDSFVSRVSPEEMQSHEAYVLFYQKKPSAQMENAKVLVREMLRKPEAVGFIDGTQLFMSFF